MDCFLIDGYLNKSKGEFDYLTLITLFYSSTYSQTSSCFTILSYPLFIFPILFIALVIYIADFVFIID